MRIFENHPPSMVVLLVCIFVGTLIAGLEFDAIFLAGVAAMALGRWLDTYGRQR